MRPEEFAQCLEDKRRAHLHVGEKAIALGGRKFKVLVEERAQIGHGMRLHGYQ